MIRPAAQHKPERAEGDSLTVTLSPFGISVSDTAVTERLEGSAPLYRGGGSGRGGGWQRCTRSPYQRGHGRDVQGEQQRHDGRRDQGERQLGDRRTRRRDMEQLLFSPGPTATSTSPAKAGQSSDSGN